MSCRQWLPARNRYCGQPSRPYIQGPRCNEHAPAKQTGRDEPPSELMEHP